MVTIRRVVFVPLFLSCFKYIKQRRKHVLLHSHSSLKTVFVFPHRLTYADPTSRLARVVYNIKKRKYCVLNFCHVLQTKKSLLKLRSSYYSVWKKSPPTSYYLTKNTFLNKFILWTRINSMKKYFLMKIHNQLVHYYSMRLDFSWIFYKKWGLVSMGHYSFFIFSMSTPTQAVVPDLTEIFSSITNWPVCQLESDTRIYPFNYSCQPQSLALGRQAYPLTSLNFDHHPAEFSTPSQIFPRFGALVKSFFFLFYSSTLQIQEDGWQTIKSTENIFPLAFLKGSKLEMNSWVVIDSTRL